MSRMLDRDLSVDQMRKELPTGTREASEHPDAGIDDVAQLHIQLLEETNRRLEHVRGELERFGGHANTLVQMLEAHRQVSQAVAIALRRARMAVTWCALTIVASAGALGYVTWSQRGPSGVSSGLVRSLVESVRANIQWPARPSEARPGVGHLAVGPSGEASGIAPSAAGPSPGREPGAARVESEDAAAQVLPESSHSVSTATSPSLDEALSEAAQVIRLIRADVPEGPEAVETRDHPAGSATPADAERGETEPEPVVGNTGLDPGAPATLEHSDPLDKERAGQD